MEDIDFKSLPHAPSFHPAHECAVCSAVWSAVFCPTHPLLCFFLCVCPRGLATPGCVLCARPPESHSVVSNTHFTAPPLPFLLRARLDPEVKPGSPLPFSRSFARFAPGLTFVSNQASPAPFVVSAQFCPNMGQNRAPPCFCPAARGRPGRASPPQPPAVLSNAHALGGENSNTANNLN